jgi:catechol 2,3-dioxygenase
MASIIFMCTSLIETRQLIGVKKVLGFKAGGEAFLLWKQHLEEQEILCRCTDHELSWSLYFNDCDGNVHEITSCEYDYVTSRLPSPTTSSVQ